jgi:hypothetical protein
MRQLSVVIFGRRGGRIMTKTVTYGQLGERLGVSAQAAHAWGNKSLVLRAHRLRPIASPTASLALAAARLTQVEAELRLTLAEAQVSDLEAELAEVRTQRDNLEAELADVRVQRDNWMTLAQRLAPKRSWLPFS